MRTLNTQRVELPDGRLVTIEGGNAETTARFISQHYLGAGGGEQRQEQEEEPPLELPSMEAQLSRPSVYGQTVYPSVTTNENEDGEEPMTMPVMNFDQREQKAKPAPLNDPVAHGDEEPPMLPPSVF
jgi:hypothetical protein